MKFNIVLDNNIVVYDNQNVEAVLVENMMNPDGDFDSSVDEPTHIFILNGGNATTDTGDDTVIG
jgi:hypothetical protein